MKKMNKKDILEELKKINTSINFDIEHLEHKIINDENWSEEDQEMKGLEKQSRIILLEDRDNLNYLRQKINEILWNS